MNEGAGTLIIGGDGLIGSALARRLPAALVTSRRRENGHLFLDLADPAAFVPPSGIRLAFLCAATTKLADCEENPDTARRINVEAPLHLARLLPEAFLVFLSTSLVFGDGEAPPTPDAPLTPLGEYGRQKAEAETRLIEEFGERTAILRVTKVVDPTMPLLRNWAADLQSGHAIRPFSDLLMAPVSLDSAVDLLLDLGTKQQTGRWNYSANRDISYAEAAAHLATRMGVPAGLVQPTTSRAAGLSIPLPPRTALAPGDLARPLPDPFIELNHAFNGF